MIHLGADTGIQAANILLFTDLQRGTTADTENLLRRMREKNLVRTLSNAPKTLVLCREGRKTVCYLTGVGLRTLSARMREDRAFFMSLMRKEQADTQRNEVQHDGRD